MKQLLILIFIFCLIPISAMADSTAIAVSDATAQSQAIAIGGGAGGTANVDVDANVEIRDERVTNVTNRQFPVPIQPEAPEQISYFGPWQTPNTPWNMFPINKKEWRLSEVKNLAEEARIDKKRITILFQLLPQKEVLLSNTEPKTMDGKWLVGYGVVRGTRNTISYEVLGVLLKEAMQHGANLVVIKGMGWQQKAQAGGWHIGFGGGVTGIVDGSTERMAVQGGGGTGIGSSSVTVEGMPWVQGIFYRDSTRDDSSNNPSLIPVERKTKDESWGIMPVTSVH